MNRDQKHQRYEELLLSWSKRVNLIGPEARRNLADHIDEAREAAEILRPEGLCLDFGSGGGLPVIPMAIDFPGANFTLVEADQKKWAFLKHVDRECALNLQVLGDRLERLLEKGRLEGPFQLVTSRAVGQPGKWIPKLAAVLDRAARVALFEHGDEAPEIAGFETRRIVPLRRGRDNYLIILQRESSEES